MINLSTLTNLTNQSASLLNSVDISFQIYKIFVKGKNKILEMLQMSVFYFCMIESKLLQKTREGDLSKVNKHYLTYSTKDMFKRQNN